VTGRRVLRHEIPVDGAWHELELGPDGIAHVATRSPDVVEVWTIHDQRLVPIPWRLIVVGTGHPLPDLAEHVGTALAPGGLVWHLFRAFE
jgi:hypothetical protein